MNFGREFDKKYSSDSLNGGFKLRVQPKFVRDINPDHLKPRVPMRNLKLSYKNRSPFKEALNAEKYI